MDVNLNQPTSCGFNVGTNFFFTQYLTSYSSSRNSLCQDNPTSFSYKPGKALEYYNGTITFTIQSPYMTTLPNGFYYFYPVGTNFKFNSAISSVLYVKYADNSSDIVYNVPDNGGAPYGNVPISQQLTMFRNAHIPLSSSSSSTSSSAVIPSISLGMNNFLGIILLLLIPIGILYYLFNVRDRNKKELNVERHESSENKRQKIAINEHKVEPSTIKNIRVCENCQQKISENDLFCANCGLRV